MRASTRRRVYVPRSAGRLAADGKLGPRDSDCLAVNHRSRRSREGGLSRLLQAGPCAVSDSAARPALTTTYFRIQLNKRSALASATAIPRERCGDNFAVLHSAGALRSQVQRPHPHTHSKHGYRFKRCSQLVFRSFRVNIAHKQHTWGELCAFLVS